MHRTWLCAAPLGLAWLLFVSPAVAQGKRSDAAALRKRLDAKLEKPFVSNVEWVRDLNAARKTAAAERKFVLAYFTRSDRPCPAADTLEAGVLASPAFAAFAKTVVPFLHVTTGLESGSNGGPLAGISAKWRGKSEPPAMFFLDAGGEVLTKQRWYGVPQLESTHFACSRFVALREQLGSLKRGDEKHVRRRRSAVPVLLQAEIELGRLAFAEAKKRVEALEGTDPMQRELLNEKLIDLEFDERFDARTERGSAFAEQVLRMKRAGRVPSSPHRGLVYWRVLLEHADAQADVALYEESLQGFRMAVAELERPELQRHVKRFTERLFELRDTGGDKKP